MNKSRSGHEAFLLLFTVHVIDGCLGFARCRENGSLVEISVAPDGSAIFTRDVGTQEIYALTLKWP